MDLFRLLFDAQWRDRGDQAAFARYTRHHESMAGQVMANRNEVAFLHSELSRVSHDLAQSMLVNRALMRLLVSKGVATPEELQEAFESTIKEQEVVTEDAMLPSKFCEDCGRPFSVPGRRCPYCSEMEFKLPEPAKKSKKKTGKKKSKEKKKKSGSES